MSQIIFRYPWVSLIVSCNKDLEISENTAESLSKVNLRSSRTVFLIFQQVHQSDRHVVSHTCTIRTRSQISIRIFFLTTRQRMTTLIPHHNPDLAKKSESQSDDTLRWPRQLSRNAKGILPRRDGRSRTGITQICYRSIPVWASFLIPVRVTNLTGRSSPYTK